MDPVTTAIQICTSSGSIGQALTVHAPCAGSLSTPPQDSSQPADLRSSILLSKHISHYTAKLTAAMFGQYRNGIFVFLYFPNVPSVGPLLLIMSSLRTTNCQKYIQDELRER